MNGFELLFSINIWMIIIGAPWLILKCTNEVYGSLSNVKCELYRAIAVFIFCTDQLRTTNSLTNICQQISKIKFIFFSLEIFEKIIDHLNWVVWCLRAAGLPLLQISNTSPRAENKKDLNHLSVQPVKSDLWYDE